MPPKSKPKICFEENPDLDEDDLEEITGEEEEEEDEQEEGADIASMMNFFFSNEEGVVVADVLTGIKNALDKQNSILMKLGAVLQKKA